MDLRLETLSVVSLRDDPELLQWRREKVRVDPEKIKLLKIGFSSVTDIVSFAKKNAYSVGYEAYLCDGAKNIQAKIYTPAYLRTSSNSLGNATYFEKSNLDELRDVDGRIIYYAVVPLESDEIHLLYPRQKSQSDNTYIPIYDYQQNLYDVCIQLTGGAMWFGTSFSSSLLVVPRSHIVNADQDDRRLK